MFLPLFFIFAVLPIIEIALLINIGEQIGGWNTVAIVIVTAFVGAHLVRQQGISTLGKAQHKMQQGEMPGQELAEGLLLLVAGVLLVTPGFVTDIIGLVFTLPFTRPLLAKQLVKQFGARNVHFQQQSSFHFRQHQAHSKQEDIIEGDFRRTDDPKIDDKDPQRPT